MSPYMAYSKVLALISMILYKKLPVSEEMNTNGWEAIPMFSLVGTMEFVCDLFLWPIGRKEHFCLAHLQVANKFCIIELRCDPT